MLPKKELKKLSDHIKANGLIEAIILHEKQVLDGRNRLVACEMSGTIPYFRNYHGDQSPCEYVLGRNLHRRDLTKSLRATIAVRALPLLKAEAKERQRLSEGRGQKGSAEVRDLNIGKSAQHAAESVGVSTRYVEQAKAIQEKAPEAFEQIANGEKTVAAATKELGWGHEPHPEPDNLSNLKAVWKKCNNQQKTAFLKWARQHR